MCERLQSAQRCLVQAAANQRAAGSPVNHLVVGSWEVPDDFGRGWGSLGGRETLASVERWLLTAGVETFVYMCLYSILESE